MKNIELHNKQIQLIFHVYILSLFFSSSVMALEIDASYGIKKYEVIYQIGGQLTLDSGNSGRIRFPISELRFLTDTPIANLKFSHTFRDTWLISISATKNLTSNSGEMQDSDWGINYYLVDPNAFPRDSLDIYSESRLTLDALDLKIEFQKKIAVGFLPLWKVLIGAGILSQRYKFAAFDTVQSYPSTPEKPADIISGKSISYRYEARMPFASTKLTRNIASQITTTISAAYSPWLKVTDHDDHILRDKTSTGDSDGWGIILSASLNYAFRPASNVYLAATYLKTVANGIQTQKNSSETGTISTAKIGLRNTNEQTSLRIGITHVF